MAASLVDSSWIETLPKPYPNPSELERISLVAQRYGTPEMAEIWGDEGTFNHILKSQGAAVSTMSKLYPLNVPPEHAKELAAAANLEVIDPQRIRVLEDKTGHDMIAINTAWGEKVSDAVGANINKARTSADSTETAKALQLKKSLKVTIDSLENLRDVTLEKSMAWRHIPHMDTTHLYDALPTVLGRPLAFYGEAIQSNLDRLGYVYNNCIIGKWADATGNHHSAKSLGMDGTALQEAYCKDLGIDYMMAPAQIPARENITAIVSEMAINAETMRNFAKFIRQHRSDDTGVFKVPRKNKGSSAMPHKDEKGGNPSLEEQTESYSNIMRGAVTTSLSSCTFDYGRDLTGSASDRIILPEVFVFGDYIIRRLAGRVYSLQPVEDRCLERVDRSYGVVTSQQLMNYLTDLTKTKDPLPRERAHSLTAKLATDAYDQKRQFYKVVMECPDVTDRLSEDVIMQITDPRQYTGESKRIIENVYNAHHGKKTLASV